MLTDSCTTVRSLPPSLCAVLATWCTVLAGVLHIVSHYGVYCTPLHRTLLAPTVYIVNHYFGQAGRRENPTRCWLEQDIREQESLYVLIQKPLP